MFIYYLSSSSIVVLVLNNDKFERYHYKFDLVPFTIFIWRQTVEFGRRLINTYESKRYTIDFYEGACSAVDEYCLTVTRGVRVCFPWRIFLALRTHQIYDRAERCLKTRALTFVVKIEFLSVRILTSFFMLFLHGTYGW